MRRMVMLVAALATVVGTGCATLGAIGGFREPVVTFKDVRLNGLGVSGGSLDVVLNVYNPNGFKLDATRLTYKLMVDTVPFGAGALDHSFIVQKKDSTEVRLPVEFSYSGIGTAANQLMRTGSVNYRVLGDVTVATPLGNFTRPYDRTGRFNSLRGTTR